MDINTATGMVTDMGIIAKTYTGVDTGKVNEYSTGIVRKTHTSRTTGAAEALTACAFL